MEAPSLLASLQPGADHRGLYARFTSYLSPFIDSHSSTRPLAKKFLSFLCEALNLLPALLRERDLIEERDNEYLDIYVLVLDCLGCLLPVLEAKPYMLHFQRVQFVRCLINIEKYEKAEAEAVLLLEDLISALSPVGKVSGSKKGKGKGKGAEPQILFPDPEIVGADDSLYFDIALVLVSGN